MAQLISIDSGSVLIGSPIEVSVQAESVGSKATFHRVKLTVRAALSTDGNFEDFYLSAPVTDGEFVTFDISDVLRTVAGKYKFSPISDTITYPFLVYNLKAWDEYMIEGILSENVAEREYGSSMYALMGAFTDAERYLSSGTKQLKTFTRKPVRGEICSQKESFVYPLNPASPIFVTSLITEGPTVKVLSLNGKSGLQSINGREIYIDSNAGNRVEFQFVNGLGVIESISAESLESLETSGTTEIGVVTAPASFAGVNRLSVTKSGRALKYKMSTGYISREWAEWWHNEFFCSDRFRNSLAESCWMNVGGSWIPCVPVIEDDVTLYDRTQDGMIRIDFTVHLAINGLVNPRI